MLSESIQVLCLSPLESRPPVDVEAIIAQRKPPLRKPSKEAIQAVKRKLSTKHSDVRPCGVV